MDLECQRSDTNNLNDKIGNLRNRVFDVNFKSFAYFLHFNV